MNFEAGESNSIAQMPNNKFVEEHVYQFYNLECEWSNCLSSFTDLKSFQKHVFEHFDLNSKLCMWYECKYSVENNETGDGREEKLYLKSHVSYHLYYSKVLSVGQYVINKYNLYVCLKPYNINIPENVGPFKCMWDNCQIVLLNILDYFWHYKCHANEFSGKQIDKRQIVCKWGNCRQEFSTFWILKDHLKTHTLEREVACVYCGTMFSTIMKLKEHLERQIDLTDDHQTSFTCSVCSKKLPTVALLKDHIKSHINDSKCNLCNMTCRDQSKLKWHIRYRHTQERNHKCTYCSFKAFTKFDLKNHQKVHSEDNEYKCKYCDFECRSIIGYKSHLTKVHDDVFKPKIFSCHICQKQFLNRGWLLTKHLLNVHKIEWPSGHSRFQYKKTPHDGFYRAQISRLERLEDNPDTREEEVDYEIISETDFTVTTKQDLAEMKLKKIILRTPKKRAKIKKY